MSDSLARDLGWVMNGLFIVAALHAWYTGLMPARTLGVISVLGVLNLAIIEVLYTVEQMKWRATHRSTVADTHDEDPRQGFDGCDRCGTGGGGLCPGCKGDADFYTR